MKRISFLLVAAAALTCVIGSRTPASGFAQEEPASIEPSAVYGVTIPSGYRDWKLISVTHEEGDFNQLRAQLGNDTAIKAYREGKLPFPDGSIIVALHWKRIPSDGDKKVFGKIQAFVPGSAVNMQVMFKGSKKYTASAVGGSLTLRTARLPPRRSTTPLSAATNLPKIATLLLPITHLETLF